MVCEFVLGDSCVFPSSSYSADMFSGFYERGGCAISGFSSGGLVFVCVA